MNNYIGTKQVSAKLVKRGWYVNYQGWDLPANEDPDDDVYMVEYAPMPSNKPNHPNHAGYLTMSPKDVFESSYRPNGRLSFGDALMMAKQGSKIARSGWNGKEMYVTIMPGYPDGIEANENTRAAHNLPKGAIIKFRPYFQLLTAQGDIAMWAPSGSDALAEDWMIV
tara:strand:+ start:9769 stop:10269 length:501 start_codon:yes stop_codon:yes gene_type:complete